MDSIKEISVNTIVRDDVNTQTPIAGRKYTVTHSDITKDLTVYIGKNFAYDQKGPKKDEVYFQILCCNTYYILKGFVDLDFPKDPTKISLRNKIFFNEMPLAISGIVKADQNFFNNHISLYNMGIHVFFSSNDDIYARDYYFGKLEEYRNYFL